MTFSTLVDKQLVTDKRSSRYGASITRVIVHHWAGTNGGVERLVQSSDLASANYIILSDGTLIGSVPEEYQAWTSGSMPRSASWKSTDPKAAGSAGMKDGKGLGVAVGIIGLFIVG